MKKKNELVAERSQSTSSFFISKSKRLFLCLHKKSLFGRCSRPCLFLLQRSNKSVFFVLVHHLLFVAVLASLRIFNTYYDLYVVTARTNVGTTLSNFCVFRYLCHCIIIYGFKLGLFARKHKPNFSPISNYLISRCTVTFFRTALNFFNSIRSGLFLRFF